MIPSDPLDPPSVDEISIKTVTYEKRMIGLKETTRRMEYMVWSELSEQTALAMIDELESVEDQPTATGRFQS
jgi:hypothetical protein